MRGTCIECEFYCDDVEHCIHCLQLICQVCAELHEEECEEKALIYQEITEGES